MLKHLLYIFPLFASVISFGQDVLVKRDSSKIEAKILEVRPDEIKYKNFNFQSGPTLIIYKNEIAYAIYSNGEREHFQDVPEPVVYINTDSLNKLRKDKLHKAKKLSDYININIDAGIVINESYVNKPYDNSIRLGSLGSPEYEDYYAPGKKQVKYGYSIGINFLAGKSPFCKHLIGINYLNSTGEFNYSHTGGVHSNETQTWLGYEKEVNYKSTVHFINVLTGVRFIIYKRLCIDNVVLVNIPVKAVNTVNGYEVNYKRSYSNYYEKYMILITK